MDAVLEARPGKQPVLKMPTYTCEFESYRGRIIVANIADKIINNNIVSHIDTKK